jgi:hypothetical protein
MQRNVQEICVNYENETFRLFGCLEGIGENIKSTRGQVRVDQNTGVAETFIEYGKSKC